MILFFNALDTEETNWAELFKKADPRIKFLGVKYPSKSVEGDFPEFVLDIIEAVWQP